VIFSFVDTFVVAIGVEPVEVVLLAAEFDPRVHVAFTPLLIFRSGTDISKNRRDAGHID